MKMAAKQFRIGQLAKELGVERFVIRFWEKEFNIQSNRSDGGQRFYTEKDLNLFKKVKQLLYEEGFTIAGAKKALKETPSKIIASRTTTFQKSNNAEDPIKEELMTFQKKLRKLKELL